MLKLPKGLKKKKKKSKKDQELFTEAELEQYKRDLKAKQEAAAAKSDAGESDAASDVEGTASTTTTTKATTKATTSASALTGQNASTSAFGHFATVGSGAVAGAATTTATTTGTTTTTTTGEASTLNNEHNFKKSEEDEEWAKFKALTSGVDSILHKTQDELDRIKKESFYQRLPSAAEKKRQEEEEAARREAERLAEERRKAEEFEANRDKLAEAVVELSESEGEQEDEVNDIFATDYIEAITSGEVQLVVPDSPVFEVDEGPDPFDTAYAEKVIVGADKAKGNKKLVSLGAAVEVLSGRVDREHALALAKPKRKLRKGIQNLLLSESVDLADTEVELIAPEPQKNLLDELADDIPESNVPIDLSVSLHLHLIQHKKKPEDEEETDEQFADGNIDLSEFDVLKDEEDDEFAELAVESLTKKEEVKVITQIPIPQPEVLTEIVAADWAEFEQEPETTDTKPKAKPVRPTCGPHIVPGAIYISEDEEDIDDDPFNTTYAEQVIKKTTVLEEDDDFDPRAEEKSGPPVKPPPPAANLLSQPTRDLLGGSATDLSKVCPSPIAPITGVGEQKDEDFDPFDTSNVNAIVQPKATELKFIERELLQESNLKHSLSDPDFDPRADEPAPATVPAPKVAVPAKAPATATATAQIENNSTDFDTARRKSSLSLNIQSKTVGFLVPDQDLLSIANDGSGNRKPLTPYYAPTDSTIAEKEPEDPFDTSYVPEAKPSDVELKHLEEDLLTKPTLKHSLSDPDFDPRAPPTPIPAEELLTVKENINTKVLTPAQESKDLPDASEVIEDPFDTSIAADLRPGETELKLLESELLPQKDEIVTGVLDTETDAQVLGLGDKVLTPSVPRKQITLPEDIDPFDTSIAENLGPGETEIKLLESELIER